MFEAIIHEFCDKEEPLINRFCNSVHSLSVDAAQNEITSSTIMRRDVRNVTKALTPNLKIVSRDIAHGSGRMLSRPWKADAYLKQICDTWFRGKRSVIQRIHNSKDLSIEFERFVKSSRSQGRVLAAEIFDVGGTWFF